MDHDVSCDLRHLAFSDNLSYIVLWIPPPIVYAIDVPVYGEGGLRRLTVYKDGQKIKDMWNPPKISAVYDNLRIDDNGAIYTVDIGNDIYTVDNGSDIYISIYPDYIPQLYKNIGGGSIVLSDNAKRYSQFVITQKTSLLEVAELDTGIILSQAPTPSPPEASPHMDILFTAYFMDNKTNNRIWVVDNNTTNWVNLPKSNILLISHSEKIIATSQIQDNNTYNVAIYERRGIDFVPPANSVDIVGKPVAVSEKFLLVALEEDGNVIRVHKIINQIVEKVKIYRISMVPRISTIPIHKREGLQLQLLEVLPGPRNTFLFMFSRFRCNNIKFFKYSIQSYDNIERFLEAKLD